MSTLNTNYINNNSRGSATDTQKNLQLGSDGSVTSYEGLSISDAAADSGDSTYVTWDGANVEQFFAFDRSKFNRLRVNGWCDLSGEATNNTNIGLFIQPCIGTTPYTISQMNNGFTGTWFQSVPGTFTPIVSQDQMVFNTSANQAQTIRWIFDLDLIVNNRTVWSKVKFHTFISDLNGTQSYQQVIRQLRAQSWNTTLGNQFNTFRIVTNSVTNVAATAQGQIGVTISRDSSFKVYV
jgi:hypothetical protein